MAEQRKGDSLRRLLEAVRKHGVEGPAALARALNESDQTLTNWASRGVSKKGAINAQTRYGISASWITDGTGPQYIGTEGSHKTALIPDDAIPVQQKNRRQIWVVGKGAGGLAERIWTDGDYPVGATEDYGEITSPDPQAFLVRVEGSSMWPKYEPGNYALIEPNTPVEVEDVVLVRLQTGETMIKRLLSQRNGYVFGSFNEQVRLEYTADAISWMYYVAHEVPRKRIKSRF